MKRDAQSLSICVPGNRCINQCKFCVVGMYPSGQYENKMDVSLPCYNSSLEKYIQRLIFAKENDANIMMLTGEIEPLQNRNFLATLAMINKDVLPNRGCAPFTCIEIQSSAVGFDENYAEFLRNCVGVSVFSFSISSFDDERNAEIVGMPRKKKIKISDVCEIAKKYDFTLRLSLNMSVDMLKSVSNDISNYSEVIPAIFEKGKSLGADQMTFRKLYSSGDNIQSRWIEANKVDDKFFQKLNEYIKQTGKLIGVLPYGLEQYSVDGISVVVDEDCMNENKPKNVSKYFVIRPNCKIYAGWNIEDLIF